MPGCWSSPAGLDGDHVLAAAEGDLREGDLFCVDERLADGGEGFGLHIVLGDDEVGLLVELGVEVVFVDELRDFHGVLGGHAEMLEFVGSMVTYSPLRVLVAFDDFVFRDGIGGFIGCVLDGGGKDLLMADALAGLARDLVEANLALGFGRDKELDAEGDERNLNLTTPIGTCHRAPQHRIDLC